MYVCMYVCVCVYMYIYIYIYTHTHTRSVHSSKCTNKPYERKAMRSRLPTYRIFSNGENMLNSVTVDAQFKRY